MKRASRSDFWLYSLLFISLTVFASGLFFYGAVGRTAGNLLDKMGAIAKMAQSAKIGDFSKLTGMISPNQRTNILIMGSDFNYTRGKADDTFGRSDTMMLVGLDPEKNRINILSIPRDTMVSIPGHRGHDKINAAMAYGGPDLAMETVSKFLDVPVDHWIRLKVDGLINLVDLIGGVKICVEKGMHYTDRKAGLSIRLAPGWQQLNGAQAHEFVRFRHDVLGDIGRVKRQQQFMQAVLEKLFLPTTMLRYPQLIEGLMRNVQTNLTSAQVIQMAGWSRTVDRRRIRMVMLPGEFSAGRTPVSYWLTDEERVHALGRKMFEPNSLDTLVADSPEARMKFRVGILNGTAQPGLATSAARILREDGWTIWGVGDADRRDYATTQVVAQKGDDDLTDILGHALGVRAEASNLGLGDMSTDFTIVLGQDFAQALRVKVSRKN